MFKVALILALVMTVVASAWGLAAGITFSGGPGNVGYGATGDNAMSGYAVSNVTWSQSANSVSFSLANSVSTTSVMAQALYTGGGSVDSSPCTVSSGVWTCTFPGFVNYAIVGGLAVKASN